MFERPIVMLDFETTGLSPEGGDRITEVAALRIAGGQVVERYVSLVNCGVRVPSFITQLTGITQAMVDGAPPVSKVVPELLDFIGGDALSAHNASFDDKFLRAEAARLGLTPGYQSLVCSLKLSRRVFPGQETMAEAIGTSKSTVNRGIQELEDKGWLNIQRRGQGKTNLYVLTHTVRAKKRG